MKQNSVHFIAVHVYFPEIIVIRLENLSVIDIIQSSPAFDVSRASMMIWNGTDGDRIGCNVPYNLRLWVWLVRHSGQFLRHFFRCPDETNDRMEIFNDVASWIGYSFYNDVCVFFPQKSLILQDFFHSWLDFFSNMILGIRIGSRRDQDIKTNYKNWHPSFEHRRPGATV